MAVATEQTAPRTKPADAFEAQLEAMGAWARHEPQWLTQIRREAAARFREQGLPTTELESWRFTRIDAIRDTAWTPAPDEAASLPAEQVEALGVRGLDGPRLVFIDGCYAPRHSTLNKAGKGVSVAPLTEAMADGHPMHAIVREHLAKYARQETDAFAALNTALMRDGALVRVATGTRAAAPITLLYVSTSSGEPTMCHPRNLVVVEDGASAQVVEDYVSLAREAHFSNVVTEVFVGEKADVEHYLLERESHAALNVSLLRIEQRAASRFASHSVLTGGALVRNNVHPVLTGEGCHSLLNGLYVVDGRRHVDNQMFVEHAAAHCDSRQYYKGILNDAARAVFAGRIKVHKGAQKTDAVQSNRNLLLSDDAQANTMPQLEIYADDVKCTHGATIGQLDADAVFYLRSRGLSRAAATAMLVRAFAGESLERMGLEPVRQAIERELDVLLPQEDLDAIRLA